MDPIAKLTAGYRDFRDDEFQAKRAAYEALVDQGQKPKVALIACSDSRVDPAMVLQADPGDLFIVRNVANLAPPHERHGQYHGTSAALEYAVRHLEVGHLIVLGHAHCGGIRSMFEAPGGSVCTAGTSTSALAPCTSTTPAGSASNRLTERRGTCSRAALSPAYQRG